MVPTFSEAVAAVLGLTAAFVTAYLAVQGNEQAAGALYAMGAAAVGYYLRGKVQANDTDAPPPPGR